MALLYFEVQCMSRILNICKTYDKLECYKICQNSKLFPWKSKVHLNYSSATLEIMNVCSNKTKTKTDKHKIRNVFSKNRQTQKEKSFLKYTNIQTITKRETFAHTNKQSQKGNRLLKQTNKYKNRNVCSNKQTNTKRERERETHVHITFCQVFVTATWLGLQLEEWQSNLFFKHFLFHAQKYYFWPPSQYCFSGTDTCFKIRFFNIKTNVINWSQVKIREIF